MDFCSCSCSSLQTYEDEPMKIIIASDIHGSAYYCRKLMELYNTEKPDRVLLLGDILYHGPRNDLPEEYNPKEVIAMLNPLADQILCVRGNCDAEVDQMVLDFPIMADYAVLEADGVQIFATHGHIYNEEKPPKAAGGILLYGHTHIPVCNKQEQLICINPGSVSIPKAGSFHSCIIYEDGTFVWKDLVSGAAYRTFYAKNRGYAYYGSDAKPCRPLTEEYPGIYSQEDLYEALTHVWSEDTCAPRMREEWSTENITCGQCSITAFLCQDIFGGTVEGVKLPDGNLHCFNRIGESVFDLTSEQFGEEKVDYSSFERQYREVHFAKEEKQLRYHLLKQRLQEYLGVTGTGNKL